jgi:hypothetical protein
MLMNAQRLPELRQPGPQAGDLGFRGLRPPALLFGPLALCFLGGRDQAAVQRFWSAGLIPLVLLRPRAFQ